MNTPNTIDDAIRSAVREVVREEIRAALDERSMKDNRRNAGAPVGTNTYLSIARASALADVAPGTLRRWIKAGWLQTRRAGRVYRIAQADLEALLSRAPGPQGVTDRARAIINRTA